MDKILDNWSSKSAARQAAYQAFLKKAEKADKNRILRQLPDLHEAAFSEVDCLACAACCKNYSPRFKPPDVKRIAKKLKMTEGVFVETYLLRDEDGDFVVKSKPCPFLGDDNFCTIYEDRPSDCRRFPYTDEDILIKKPKITLKNSTFCPAVYFVLEKLMG